MKGRGHLALIHGTSHPARAFLARWVEKQRFFREVEPWNGAGTRTFCRSLLARQTPEDPNREPCRRANELSQTECPAWFTSRSERNRNRVEESVRESVEERSTDPHNHKNQVARGQRSCVFLQPVGRSRVINILMEPISRASLRLFFDFETNAGTILEERAHSRVYTSNQPFYSTGPAIPMLTSDDS